MANFYCTINPRIKKTFKNETVTDTKWFFFNFQPAPEVLNTSQVTCQKTKQYDFRKMPVLYNFFFQKSECSRCGKFPKENCMVSFRFWLTPLQLHGLSVITVILWTFITEIQNHAINLMTQTICFIKSTILHSKWTHSKSCCFFLISLHSIINLARDFKCPFLDIEITIVFI